MHNPNYIHAHLYTNNLKSWCIERGVINGRREMEREIEELKIADPVSYWKQRSRKALESQGVVLQPRWRYRSPDRFRPDPDDLPPGVVLVRNRRERVGLDLICGTCARDTPKSKILDIMCLFYSPDGPAGSPLTRCHTLCPHCLHSWVLGRSIGDADNFHVIAGATKYLFAGNSSTDPNPSLPNEAYPDAILDSPNDFKPYTRDCVTIPGEDFDMSEYIRLRRGL
ncbi:hypothetical protein PHJA_002430000 [Phtheirospermum japonicum]|uniref:Uncharacterized protein n=1 Tax=Phtheirospermum japonicum TaxID=374723 RepID=A0A830CSM5_9LAMI|nr:hypothetical protein PHJA_002430000 [Phtheirospermum japonicum]